MLEQINYCNIDQNLDVRCRLADIKLWQQQYDSEVEAVDIEMRKSDLTTSFGLNRTSQLAKVRTRLSLNLVREPLSFVSAETIKIEDTRAMDEQLRSQYIHLSLEERLLWLNNLYFIMTPDLHAANKKLAALMEGKKPRQRRGMVLFGESGMGKSSYLDFLWCQFKPTVAAERNIVPFMKADAPASNSAVIALPQRFAFEFGNCVTKSDTEEQLNLKLQAYTQICSTVIGAIDEAESIQTRRMRRKVIELWNFFPNVVMIAASVNIELFVSDDSQIQGRFNVPHELKEFQNGSLIGLLAFLDLILPLPNLSSLFTDKMANIISSKTKGRLDLIVGWITTACRIALERRLPRLTEELLTEAWNNFILAEPDRWNGKKVS